MPFPVDPKFIESCEAKLGITFPTSFKEGMTELNGGEVETEEDLWTLHPFFDTSDKKRIKRTTNHIIAETESAKDSSGYPDVAVTIGRNECGDLLVLLPDGSQFEDIVYRWNHETGELQMMSPTTEILMNSRS